MADGASSWLRMKSAEPGKDAFLGIVESRLSRTSWFGEYKNVGDSSLSISVASPASFWKMCVAYMTSISISILYNSRELRHSQYGQTSTRSGAPPPTDSAAVSAGDATIEDDGPPLSVSRWPNLLSQYIQ